MTTNVLEIALPAAAGFGIGLFYFFGLRLTLRIVQTSRRPVTVLLASFFSRTIIAAGLFALVGGDSLRRFGLALLGFIVARMIVVAVGAGTRENPMPSNQKEAT